MHVQNEFRWVSPAALATTGLALLLYGSTAAPGLTWAHYGADGGDFLAAAAVNGVPHPPGYPLYTWLLQGWLMLGHHLVGGSPARVGVWFSVLCAALSVGVTVVVASALLAPRRVGWLWASLAGLAWMTAPLLWGQALITEVYALHALLAALIGWATLTARPRALAVALGFGLAHHLTSVLLWPAVLFWLWTQPGASPARLLRVFGAAWLIGALFYLRIPWAAAAAPPVNWGYADNLSGFWWLVSSQAYRDYFFGVPLADLPGRMAAWARVIAVQFTPVGLGIALIGLADWDQQAPRLRTFGLLWTLPLSLYALSYHTTDSEVYLLPAVWCMALWFANGLAVGVDWLYVHTPLRAARGATVAAVAGLALFGIVFTAAWRLPEMSLRQDHAAEDYLAAAATILEPGSLVISRADAETFALWYGAWGSEALSDIPELVLINEALYQFDWYRRLLAQRYPDIQGIGGPFDRLLTANIGVRPIFLTEPMPELPGSRQEVGPFWRLAPR